MKSTPLALGLCLLGFTAQATDSHSHKTSTYAGQETRQIKSLSAADISELRKGGGWGLAKAAELNGVPGPAHLLELKDKIGLSKEQVAKLELLFQDMQKQAIIQGEQLIDFEARLEQLFNTRTVTETSLRTALQAISNARMELRYVHLQTHLKTPGILSEDQISDYNRLRGYSTSSPCDKTPEGHNAAMWRKHNSCE